jgi:hypothetical protein
MPTLSTQEIIAEMRDVIRAHRKWMMSPESTTSEAAMSQNWVETLTEWADALEAAHQETDLRPWVQHRPECAVQGDWVEREDYTDADYCTCDLAKVLKVNR